MSLFTGNATPALRKRQVKLTDSVETCVDTIIARTGRDLRVGVPLGLGKPNHLLNALYRRAVRDPDLRLTLYTALTLQRPRAETDLERRFLEPFAARVFGNYPDLEYELDRVRDALPPNVRVHEFYFQAGKYMGSPQVQRDYISTNYTCAARDLASRGVNVLMQQVAVEESDSGDLRLSLSCNADVSPDLMEILDDKPEVTFVCQTSRRLPFMLGDAEMAPEHFDVVVHDPARDYTPFSIPKTDPVPDAEALIGLYASTLVQDRGELQLGIGSLGDSVAYALCLRQRDNPSYVAAVRELGVEPRAAEALASIGSLEPFERGLFASTEMLTDSVQPLWEAGVLKRRVYDDEHLQALLNEERIDEQVTPETLRLLLERGAIQPQLDADDVAYLRRHGVFHADVRFEAEHLVVGDRLVTNDLADRNAFEEVAKHCLGSALTNGAVAHASFFLGRSSFYAWLEGLSESERALIQMRPVTRVNQLYGHERLRRLQRTRARFMNTAMMVTLSGAVVSDGLEDGRVVSGVGGQQDFVAMGHALSDGRAIIQVRATREGSDGLTSNILPEYGHTTLPRQQRDIVVTEYGVAVLRGKTDEEVAQALIRVADSRFQPQLVETAKRKGTLAPGYRIPEAFRHNLPTLYAEKLAKLRSRGLFPPFPFGSDLTEQEQVLAKALRRLRKLSKSPHAALRALGRATLRPAAANELEPYLKRMGLARPATMRERFERRLLEAALSLEPALNGRER